MSFRSSSSWYPSGGATTLLGDATPQEGDEITRNGDTWIVEEVTEGDDGETVVTLRPVPYEVPSTDDAEHTSLASLPRPHPPPEDALDSGPAT